MDIIDEIRSFLDKNKINYDYVSQVSDDTIEIFVDGDWKHDHARVKTIMTKKGYTYLGQENISNSGEDSYSSIHYYKQNGK